MCLVVLLFLCFALFYYQRNNDITELVIMKAGLFIKQL